MPRVSEMGRAAWPPRRSSCSSRRCLARGSSVYPRALWHRFALFQDPRDLVTPCKIPLGLGKDHVHDLSVCQLSSSSQGWGHQRGPQLGYTSTAEEEMPGVFPGSRAVQHAVLSHVHCFLEEPGPFITNSSNFFLGYLAPFFDTTSWEKKK